MAENQDKDSLENAAKAVEEIKKLEDDPIKAGNPAINEFDIAAEEMKKIDNAAIEAGKDATKEFDTADGIMRTMRTVGNDILEAFDTAENEIENFGKGTMPINKEQEKVIKKLEQVLSYLKCVPIKNEECFENIKRPLEDVLSSLKYLPARNYFDSLPPEITENILSYLCDNGAFVAAAVCTEWKEILKSRLKGLEGICIGAHCSNLYGCQNNNCFPAAELLEVSVALKLDVPFKICGRSSLRDVDSHLLDYSLV